MKHVLDAIGVKYEEITVGGVDYVVTVDTGERNYGDGLGGSAAFAYPSEVVADISASDYGDFCDQCSPVGPDDADWDELAVALARRGRRLTIAGACTPALSDREYRLVRLAALAAEESAQ